MVERSVSLISQRISSRDLEMKVDSPRRRPLIRSSRLRWNKLSMREFEDAIGENGNESG